MPFFQPCFDPKAPPPKRAYPAKEGVRRYPVQSAQSVDDVDMRPVPVLTDSPASPDAPSRNSPAPHGPKHLGRLVVDEQQSENGVTELVDELSGSYIAIVKLLASKLEKLEGEGDQLRDENRELKTALLEQASSLEQSQESAISRQQVIERLVAKLKESEVEKIQLQQENDELKTALLAQTPPIEQSQELIDSRHRVVELEAEVQRQATMLRKIGEKLDEMHGRRRKTHGRQKSGVKKMFYPPPNNTRQSG